MAIKISGHAGRARYLVQEARKSGLMLSTRGGRLYVKPSGKITDYMRSALSAHKFEVMDWLKVERLLCKDPE